METVISPITTQKPKTNYLNLILISLAFVLFIAGVYFLGKQSSTIPVSTPVGVLPKTTVVPTVTTNPTANWKTYKTINNLSFDIPFDWQEQKNSSISSVDGKMAIWIENSAMGLTCLEKIKQTSNTVVNKKVEIEYYQGLTNENCTNPTDRLIFISLNSISPKFSFSFSYNQNNQTEAEKIFTQILSTFKFTESKAEIPKSISDFYSAINKYFKSNLVAVSENQFYSNSGPINKQSWNLDLSKVNKAKGLIGEVFINQFNMEFGPGGGARGGAGMDEYVNDKLDCFYSYGVNSTGGPDTWDTAETYSNISCVEK